MQTSIRDRQNLTSLTLPATSEEILGIFLKDPGLFREYRRKVNPVMFGGYAWLFQLMHDLDEQNALNFKSVLLSKPDQAETLQYLRNSIASVNRLPTLIGELKEEHLRGMLQTITTRAGMQLVSNDTDIDDILNDLKTSLSDISGTESGELSDPESDVDAWYRWLVEVTEDPAKALGLMTGIEEIDRITTGFHRQDLIVVGARTSIGKSAFMIETVLRLTRNGYKTGIFSLEMSKRQIYNRMMSNLLGVSHEALRTGMLDKSFLPKVAQAREFLKQIYVDDTRGISSEYITDAMQQIKRARGLDFVVVDYLQDVKEKGETNDNQGSALARVCRKLRTGAQKCDVALMGLSQVTRAVEDRKDKRPGSADLSGSTGIETSADVIAMLYRDDYYDPGTPLKNIMEINFTKQRNGSLGKVELYYDKECQRLLPLTQRNRR